MLADACVLLTPLAVLAILALYRFVGCDLIFTLDAPPPLVPYPDIVKQTAGAVAYWRLGEAGGPVAIDEIGPPTGPHPATYTTIPGGLAADANLHSAAAPGTITPGQPALREGADALTSTRFDGGFALHAFDAALNPPQFTIEAWVRPEWPAESLPNYHVVIESHEKAPGNQTRGFILQAGPDPANENVVDGPTFWQVRAGTGAALETLLGPPVNLNDRAHLVVTCNGTTLELWVDLAVETPDMEGPSASRALPLPFVPNAGRPLYIGAGRTDVSGSGTPRFPFQGRIQDVSLYSRVLSREEIVQHGTVGDGIVQ